MPILKQHKPSKGITFAIPYDTNEALEQYIKERELQTGVKPTKKQVIIHLINKSLKV